MQLKYVRGGLLAAVSILAIGFGTALLRADTRPAPGMQDLAVKGEWLVTTQYAADDLVFSRGSTWRAKVANKGKQPGATNPNNAAFWEFFAEGFNPTGAWINNKVYHINDLVTLNGQTWRAKITNVNASPAANANWELFAAKGAAGAAGPNTGIGAGSQSVPSISFNGDPNTGIFSPGADQIAIVAGGQLLMHNKGNGNTALGLNAISTASPGAGNTAVGASALASVTSSGNDNTAIGQFALSANQGGDNNVAIGRSALANNTEGSFNTAVGYQALMAQTTTNGGNTAFGALALAANTEGTTSTAIGGAALASNTTGLGNTALGAGALNFNTTGNFNSAAGGNALGLNTTGSQNVAFGRFALGSSQTGANSTALGYQALQNATGGGNTAVGKGALGAVFSGTNNIGIGQNAGVDAGPNGNSNSNSIYIGSGGVSGDNAVLRIGTQGTQATAFMAGISGVQAGDTPVYVDSTTGQLGIGPAPSSLRFKYDIEAMADMSVLLSKLRPVTYRYKQAKGDGSHPLQYGLIAEEVAELNPDLAMFDRHGQPNGVKYHLLPSFLLAGYQAQQKTIDALQEQDRQKSEKVEALEARLARLEAMLPRVTKAALQ
jgi:hypothetical protein